MMRRALFRLATWRDPRNCILPVDEAAARGIRENPSLEGNIRMSKAMAALRYMRELSN